MSAKNKLTDTQILIPMCVMALTLVLLFASNISQIMRDRDGLNQAMGRLEAPFADSQKLNQQFGGLVAGSQKLAQKGNKSAKKIVKQLKEIGVIVEPPKQDGKAPVPGALAKTPKGPKKP